MTEITNWKEKRLIIARHIIIKGIEPIDENIISEWCKPFSADKSKLNDPELFEWMRRFVSNNNAKSCKEQLARLRRKCERNLKERCKHIGYGAKLTIFPRDALATYSIFTKGKKYSGNYNKLCRRIGRLPKNKTEQGEK